MQKSYRNLSKPVVVVQRCTAIDVVDVHYKAFLIFVATTELSRPPALH